MKVMRGQLIVVVLVAAVAEVALLRFALRLGPVLPTQANVLPAFAVVEWLGVVALNAGVLASSALIGLAALEALRGGPSRAPLAIVLLAAVVVNLGLQPLIGTLPDRSAGLLQAGVTGAAVLLTVLGSSRPLRTRLVLVLVGIVQLLALAQTVTHSMPWPGGAAGGWGPIVLAEAVAVVAALALPWLLQVKPQRIEVLTGAAAGVAIAVGAAVQPWGLATVAIWTTAFSLFLPPLLYGAAVMSVLVTVLALRRQPGSGELAAGLVLVWLAGLKLDVSSYALMTLAGLVIASRPTAPLAITADGSDVNASQATESVVRRLTPAVKSAH